MVGIDGGRLTVSKYREVLASVRLIDVLHVCAYGNVQVTAQAMRTLFERDVDVFHFTVRRLAARPDDRPAEQERHAADPADHGCGTRAPGCAAADDRGQDPELPGAAAAQRR